MLTMEAHVETVGNGGGGFIPGDRLPVDEADRPQLSEDGMGFFQFVAAKLTGKLIPQPHLSDHHYINGDRSRRDIAPKFENGGHLG